MKKRLEIFILRFLSVICFIITGLGFLFGLVSLPIGLILIAIGVLFLFLGLYGLKSARKIKESITPIKKKSSTIPPQPVTAPIKPIPEPTPISVIEPTPAPVAPKLITPPAKKETHRVTGVAHYLENLLALRSENDDYNMGKKELRESYLINEPIYKYDFYPIKTELIPEPDNPHDPKAIKVVIDGEHIGYIKAGSCSHVLNLINENRIKKIDCEIRGGEYKYLSVDEYDEDDKGELTKDTYDYKVTLTLTLNEK